MKTIEVEKVTWGDTAYSLVTVTAAQIIKRSRLLQLTVPVGTYTESNAPSELLQALKALGQ